MSGGPSITVFIPTFNRLDLLRRAVDSVLSEDRVPIVLHILDNASSDGTDVFARELMAADPRVRYLRRQENIGATANYIDALTSIDTEYFVPLADDDELVPDFLHDAYVLLGDHPAAAAAAFITEARHEDGRVLGTYPPEPSQTKAGFLEPAEHMRSWLLFGHYSWSAVLWRRRVLDILGPPYLHTVASNDLEFQAQIFTREPVVRSNRVGAIFRQHGGNRSMQTGLADVTDWAKMFERMDDAVISEKLFEPAEYARLRGTLISRVGGSWRRPAPALDPESRLQAATSAAFRLRDWKAVSDLLADDAMPVDPGAFEIAYVSEPLSPQGHARKTMTMSQETAVDFLRWIGGTVAPLATELEAMKSERDALELIRDDLQARCDSLMSISDARESKIRRVRSKLDRTQAKLADTRAELRRSREQVRRMRQSRVWRYGAKVSRVVKPFARRTTK